MVNKNKKCDTIKNKRINLKEIDASIKKTREEVEEIENEILTIHRKMSLLL